MTEHADDLLCARIRRAEQALVAHHDKVLRAYDLTMAQYTVLLALSGGEDLSGARLARTCGVTQQTMSTVLTTLETKGLVARNPSPVHAKVKIVTLTKAGSALLDRAYREVTVLEQALAERFTEAEYRRFCEFLGRATETLVEQT